MIEKGGQYSKSKLKVHEICWTVGLMCSDPASELKQLAVNNALTAYDSRLPDVLSANIKG